MKTGFRGFWQAVKDICFPPVCLVCKTGLGGGVADRQHVSLCADCLARVVFLREPLCRWCGKTFPGAAGNNHLCGYCLQHGWHFTAARSVIQYQGVLAGVIQAFKYGENRTALSTFAILKESLPHLQVLEEPDLILPVPLHPERLRQRGFNQALVLAKTFFPGQRAKINTTVLARTRRTAAQTGLSGAARRKNIKGAFTAVEEKVAGRKIILIDDVFTTGTTVDECARVLCKAGAQQVHVLTLARATL
jgi:ComF family protein